MRKQQTSTDQPESTWDPCSRPCCVKPLPTTAIKVPASKELLLPDWECLRVSKYIKLLCHQLICYHKYAHYLWILLGHRCWLMLPLYLNFWTVQNYFWIGLNSHELPTKQASSYRPRVWGDKWNPETWQEPHRKGFSLNQTKQWAIAQTRVCHEQLLTEATQAQQCPEGTQKQKKDVSSAGSAHCQIKFPDVAQTAQLLVKKIGWPNLREQKSSTGTCLVQVEAVLGTQSALLSRQRIQGLLYNLAHQKCCIGHVACISLHVSIIANTLPQETPYTPLILLSQ